MVDADSEGNLIFNIDQKSIDVIIGILNKTINHSSASSFLSQVCGDSPEFLRDTLHLFANKRMGDISIILTILLASLDFYAGKSYTGMTTSEMIPMGIPIFKALLKIETEKDKNKTNENHRTNLN